MPWILDDLLRENKKVLNTSFVRRRAKKVTTVQLFYRSSAFETFRNWIRIYQEKAAKNLDRIPPVRKQIV
jgi:geranylgeranyl pyrophosphate synthase